MKKVENINIDIDTKNKQIKYQNDVGIDVVLDNIMIVGGNSEDHSLIIFAEGTSDKIGECLAGSFVWSRQGKSQSHSFFRSIFGSFLRFIVKQLNIKIDEPRQEDNIESILERWEREDKEKEENESKKYWN